MSVPPVEQGMAFTIPVITEAACSTVKQKLLGISPKNQKSIN